MISSFIAERFYMKRVIKDLKLFLNLIIIFVAALTGENLEVNFSENSFYKALHDQKSLTFMILNFPVLSNKQVLLY